MPSNLYDQPFADGDGTGSFWLIEQRVHFPDSSHAAWFDYATAIIGVNEAYDAEAKPEPFGELTLFPIAEVALLHERFHLLQSVTFPYFWRWCVAWRSLTAEAWHSAGSESRPVRTTLQDLPQALPPNLSAEIRGHLSALTNQGFCGLSALHLLEAHAMLGEVWALARQESVTDVCAQLDRNAPHAGYRLAFDVARLWAGDHVALEVFPALVAASFCFDRPVRAFEQLLHHIVSLPDQDRTIAGLCRTGVDTELGRHFLGLPAEQAQELSSFNLTPHGIICRRLLDELTSLGVELNDLLGHRRSIAWGAAAVGTTVLYAPDETGHAAVFLGQERSGSSIGKDSAEYRRYKRERFLMTVSQRLLQECMAPSGGAPVSPEYSWLPFVSEERLPITIRLPLEPSTLTHRAMQLAEDLSIRELRAPVTSASLGNAYLGHGVLEFVTSSPLEVWQDPIARELVQAISAVCPEFPLFLMPTQEMFVVWFGCLTDLDGVTSAGFAIGHPSAKRAIGRFIDAARECVEVTGLDIFPLVHLMLAPVLALRRSRVKAGTTSEPDLL